MRHVTHMGKMLHAYSILFVKPEANRPFYERAQERSFHVSYVIKANTLKTKNNKSYFRGFGMTWLTRSI
jgi:hypothetical protein